MSGETARDESAWTIPSLHQHLNARIDNLEKRLAERFQQQGDAVDQAFAAHEKLTNVQITAAKTAVDAALASAEKAVGKAESANEKRFESVNEFRAQLTDQAALFLPRTEYAANHQALIDQVTDLKDRLNRREGSNEGVRMSAGVLVSVVTIAVVILGVIIAFANYASG